jgi:hypothetical protein
VVVVDLVIDLLSLEYMEFLISALFIIQSMGISLGTGSSTLAILNFFHAISDGTISDTERDFMGITYIVLRVAMGIILVSTLLLCFYGFGTIGESWFTGERAAQAVLIGVLFLNAFLMTMRIMPSTFGPAIQASSWYSLGFILAFTKIGYEVNFLIFLFAYATTIFFAISLINAIMAYLKEKRVAAPVVE